MENQTQVSTELKEFIEANGNFYGLGCDFEGLKVIWKEPTPMLIQKAERDFNLFQERQKAINARTRISEGDWIVRADGSYERISVASHGWLQGGKDNGSIYISQTGHGSFSGSCGSPIGEYIATESMKEGSCWLFSGDSAGAHRGVWHKLQFKVWKEI